MAITAQQLADIRADIGDESSAIWTDDEISRVWERVSGATSTNQRHEATLALLVRQLLGNAVMLRDYTAGATAEKQSQVFSQLQKLYALYKDSLDSALGTDRRQVARGWVKGAPRQGREFPDDYYDDERNERPL